MATPVSHMDDLDMVHIRRKNEKGKKIKKEKQLVKNMNKTQNKYKKK